MSQGSNTTHRSIRLRAALAMFLTIAVSACTKVVVVSDSTSPGPSPSATTAPPSPTQSPSVEVTPSPEPSPPPEPEPEEEPQLPDGESFGRIVGFNLDTDPKTMVFDLAYLLTGQEAKQAAKDHGDTLLPGQTWYIVNDNPKLRTLDINEPLTVHVYDYTNGPTSYVTLSLAEFAGEFPGGASKYSGAGGWYQLTVDEGEVVKVEEIYLS